MARPRGSSFITILPIGKQYNIGMINWGFVNGKTQCNYPWDSWQNPYTTYQPPVWFHEVFRNDLEPVDDRFFLKDVRVMWNAQANPDPVVGVAIEGIGGHGK